MPINSSRLEKRGILLVNLGSPATTSVKDVRKYLHQFLMDKYVIDVPYFLRKLIVGLFILPFRPQKSAEAYQSIWWERGSPLLVINRRVQELLQATLKMPVELAMRYGNPSIAQGLQSLLNPPKKLREILLIPLYPHYALATYETVVAEVKKQLARPGRDVALIVQPPFYEETAYIEALVESARKYLEWNYDHLLFSYHGVPERHLKKSDPTRKHCLRAKNCCSTASQAHATCYRYQVLCTTQAFVQKAGIPEGKYSVAFQSRLGKDNWLTPFTDAEIVRLAKSGIQRLLVICPAFVSDCLETLEEIGIRGKESFLEAGGKEFRLIPCLNDHPRWIEALKGWCTRTNFSVKGGKSSGIPIAQRGDQ